MIYTHTSAHDSETNESNVSGENSNKVYKNCTQVRAMGREFKGSIVGQKKKRKKSRTNSAIIHKQSCNLNCRGF